jgi:hypothetical protein
MGWACSWSFNSPASTLFRGDADSGAIAKTSLSMSPRNATKTFPAPQILIRHLRKNPRASTVAVFATAGIFLGIAGWFMHRNLRHNEPGLRTPQGASCAQYFGHPSVSREPSAVPVWAPHRRPDLRAPIKHIAQILTPEQ